MTFEELKKLALGSITVEELSQGLVQRIGEVSIKEATTLVEAAKLSLQAAIAEGDDALDARVKEIEESLSTGDIHLAIEALKGQVSGIDERLSTAEGEITGIKSDIEGFKTTTEQRFGTVEQNHSTLSEEVEKLKSTVGGKNNATQVFADMEEFKAYSTAKKEEGSLIKGDMAYVISVKKSYIYNPDLVAVKLDNPTPPEGWMFFDEISTDLDLADYAKKAEVAQQLAEKAEKVHTHEMSDVTGLEDTLAEKLEKADLADLEGKVQANEDAITLLNGGAEQAGSVDYKIKQVKDALDKVDEGLRTDVDQAKKDILANAAAIAEITASKFILSRKQELIDVVNEQTAYELTAANVSQNFIADVFVNSVRLVEGEDKDYTLVGKTLTLTKARSTGSVIQVLFTFISDAE